MQDHGDRPLRGILFRVGSADCLVVTGICIKSAPAVPIGEAMFIRSASALAFILLAVVWRGHVRATLRTQWYLEHLRRGLIGAAGIYFLFGAYSHLPITEVTTLLYASPFLIVAVSAIALGEQVGALRWFAVSLGFAGVLVVAWPRVGLLASDGSMTHGAALGLLFAIAAVMTNVAANFAVRHMVGMEKSETIALYFSLICSLAALATIPFGWIVPGIADICVLISAGLAGAVQHFLLAEAFRNARMSVIAPFEYSSILFAVLSGIVLFSEWPGLHSIVGGAIVVVSGILILLQQARRGTSNPTGTDNR